MVHDDDQSVKFSELLKEWQQGDIVQIAGLPFVYLADLRNPLTQNSKEFAKSDPQSIHENPFAAIARDASAFVIISQSCDIIKELPTLQVAPLQVVSRDTLSNVKKGSSANFLFLPAYETESIVANLDCIMTVEKSVLLLDGEGPKKRAVRNDQELKTLGVAIARKFNRFAFPDDFNKAMSKFQKRVKDKTGKGNAEGVTYNSIAEIRVVTANAWESANPHPEFLFFFENENSITADTRKFASELVSQFEFGGKYPEKPKFRCVTYKDVDADTFRRSFPLDLDYLSNSKI